MAQQLHARAPAAKCQRRGRRCYRRPRRPSGAARVPGSLKEASTRPRAVAARPHAAAAAPRLLRPVSALRLLWCSTCIAVAQCADDAGLRCCCCCMQQQGRSHHAVGNVHWWVRQHACSGLRATTHAFASCTRALRARSPRLHTRPAALRMLKFGWEPLTTIAAFWVALWLHAACAWPSQGRWLPHPLLPIVTANATATLHGGRCAHAGGVRACHPPCQRPLRASAAAGASVPPLLPPAAAKHAADTRATDAAALPCFAALARSTATATLCPRALRRSGSAGTSGQRPAAAGRRAAHAVAQQQLAQHARHVCELRLVAAGARMHDMHLHACTLACMSSRMHTKEPARPRASCCCLCACVAVVPCSFLSAFQWLLTWWLIRDDAGCIRKSDVRGLYVRRHQLLPAGRSQRPPLGRHGGAMRRGRQAPHGLMGCAAWTEPEWPNAGSCNS